jgi:hypothetical protein
MMRRERAHSNTGTCVNVERQRLKFEAGLYHPQVVLDVLLFRRLRCLHLHTSPHAQVCMCESESVRAHMRAKSPACAASRDVAER